MKIRNPEGFGLKLHLEIRTHWLSRVSTHPGGAVVNIQVPSTIGVRFFYWNSPYELSSYERYTEFKMATAAILNLLRVSVLVTYVLFPVSAAYILAKACQCTSTGDCVIAFCGNSKWRTPPPSWILR